MMNIIKKAFDTYKRELLVDKISIFDTIQEYLNETFGDNRYKLFVLARTTSNRSMIIKYRNTEYYLSYDYLKEYYDIERR